MHWLALGLSRAGSFSGPPPSRAIRHVVVLAAALALLIAGTVPTSASLNHPVSARVAGVEQTQGLAAPPGPQRPPLSATDEAAAEQTCAPVSDNPWGYTFCGPGQLVLYTPPTFCSKFACIPAFDRGPGYVVECADGLFSHSGGVRGVCYFHGGVKNTLYVR